MRKIFLFTLTIATVLFWYGCNSDDVEAHGSIHGIIVDNRTSEPIRGAGVELFRWSEDSRRYLLATRTVTGNEGQFEFRELIAGRYQLNVLANGFQNTLFNVEVRAGIVSRADMQMIRTPRALVRFQKITDSDYLTTMMIVANTWPHEIIVSHQFGRGSDISDYYEIPPGIYDAEVWFNEIGWSFVPVVNFNFRDGRRYTFVHIIEGNDDRGFIRDDGEI